MPSELYVKYHRLFRDEEHYNEAYRAFSESFFDDRSLSQALGMGTSDFILDTLIYKPEEAKQELLDYIEIIVSNAWEEQLYRMQEEKYEQDSK